VTDYYAFLRTLYFFKDLPDDDIRYMVQFCHEESFSKGEIVFHEFDTADKFYIIRSGSVEIWKNFEKKDAVRIAIQGRGHVFGEMALVDDLPRSATICVHEDLKVIYILHNEFEHIMSSRTRVTMSILRSLSSIVRNSNDEFMQNLAEQNRALEIANRELKDAQDQILRNERLSNLGKFASFVLHDLRNPIAAIRGYAEMIQFEDDEQGSLTNYAKRIVLEADHLNRFANDILDYSRGQVRLQYTLTTVESIFSKLQSYMAEAMRKRNIAFTMSNFVKQPVYLDEDRILRALTNVLDNARKASSSGGKVMIEARDDFETLRFKIEDNGEGMAPEVLEKIFEPFYSSSKLGGTGLGMLIVKNVIEAHGGLITIQSEVAKGTVLSLSLPFKP